MLDLHTSAPSQPSKTSLIYSLLQNHQYNDAIKHLSAERLQHPRSRSCLSLLAYCYYHLQDYEQAAILYYELLSYYNEVSLSYHLYYIQSLIKSNQYSEATVSLQRLQQMIATGIFTTTDAEEQQLQHLNTVIAYEGDDLTTATKHLKQWNDKTSGGSAATQGKASTTLPAGISADTDPQSLVSYGCIAYKYRKWKEAEQVFVGALQVLGFQPDISYNLACCYYQQQRYTDALREVNEIIRQGVTYHPELSVGSMTDGLEVRSVGNSLVLKETYMIEAFNLKIAIEFTLKNYTAAIEALTDLPPRNEHELDPVTLHNSALVYMEQDPSAALKKLMFLLGNPPFPPVTFSNILLLYIKYEMYDLAADVLAENIHLTTNPLMLAPELYELMEAIVTIPSNAAEAYYKLDQLATTHVDNLRKLTKHIQDARLQHNPEQIATTLQKYDTALERYIPVLMSQAKIYWDLHNYAQVEKILRESAEFCSEHEQWRLFVGHVFFMSTDGKFGDAIRYYEPIVQKQQQQGKRLLDLTAIILANLCVSYIMTNQNEQAEELMKQIEREEEEEDETQKQQQQLQQQRTADGASKPPAPAHSYHLCIVNLVIGTLYCSKGNYEFGISRIIKSLEPYEKKLGPDTWYYAKRCLLSLFEMTAKHMMLLKDDFYTEVMQFLEAVEEHGKDIITLIPQANGQQVDPKVHNVAYEARMLKKLVYRLREV